MKPSHLVLAMLGAGTFACGSSGGPSPAAQTDAGASQETGSPMPEAGPVEAAAEAAGPVNHGSPSSTYPAFPPNFPQITDQGGSVMKSPVVVAITWTSDASEAMFDTFADGIGGTAYWKATTSEYGIGPAVSGTANHVHLTTTAPAQLQDSDIQSLVTANAGTTAGWPAPTADTVYAFFLPPGTSLQTQGLGGGGAGRLHRRRGRLPRPGDGRQRDNLVRRRPELQLRSGHLGGAAVDGVDEPRAHRGRHQSAAVSPRPRTSGSTPTTSRSTTSRSCRPRWATRASSTGRRSSRTRRRRRRRSTPGCSARGRTRPGRPVTIRASRWRRGASTST